MWASVGVRILCTPGCQANDLTWVFRFSIEAVVRARAWVAFGRTGHPLGVAQVRITGIMGYMFVRSWRLALVACG